MSLKIMFQIIKENVWYILNNVLHVKNMYKKTLKYL